MIPKQFCKKNFEVISIKRLVKAVTTVTLFTVATRLLSFLYRILLSRSLGAEGMGSYQMITSLFFVLLTMTSSGIPLTVSRMTAEATVLKNQRKSHEIATGALVSTLLMILPILLTVPLAKSALAQFFPSETSIDVLILLLPALVASCAYSAFRGSIWGKQRFFAFSLIEFLEEVFLASFGLVFFAFAKNPTGKLFAAASATTISFLLAAAVSCIVYFKSGGRLAFSAKTTGKLLRASAPITGIRLSATLLSGVTSFLLPLRLVASGMTKRAALANFGAVSGMALPLLSVPSALIGSLALVLIPELSNLKQCGKEQELDRRLQGALDFSVFASIILVPCYLALGTPICTFLFGDETAGIYLSRAAFLLLPMGLNQIASSSLNALGLEHQSFRNFLFGSVPMLCSVFFLPKFIGANALLIGTGASITLSATLNLIALKRATGLSLSVFKKLASLSLFALISALFGKLLFPILEKVMPLFFALSLSLGVCVVILLLFLLIFRPISLLKIGLFQKNSNISVA